MVEFLRAVRTRSQPSCLIEDAYRSTATVQLGMIAYETASTIEWDSAAETIPGNPAASQLLKREYRAPWKHPYEEGKLYCTYGYIQRAIATMRTPPIVNIYSIYISKQMQHRHQIPLHWVVGTRS